MGWGASTWCRLTTEQAGSYGVYYASGTTISPSLDKPNAMTMRVMPQRQIIRTADGGNRRKWVVANRAVCTGTLNTLMHPDQATFWATALTPTGTPPVLPSITIDFWDTIQAWRFLGAVITDFKITASATADYVPVSVSFIAQKRDGTFTTFAQPAETVYSTLTPYAFVESAGNVKLGGSAITLYNTMSIDIKNVIKGTWDEQSYITSALYCGRDIDFTLGPQYLATTYRTDFTAQTAMTWQLELLRQPLA